MARYRIEITQTAEKQLKKLNRDDQRRVAKTIRALAYDLYPQGSRKLTGYDDVFRVRVGSYRILHSVSGKTLVIIILQTGHRRNAYR